jgi:hypothetical protein
MIFEIVKFAIADRFSFSSTCPACIRGAMSSSGRPQRPALAKVKAGTGEPFSALLAAAVENASAAQGLALAYAALERPQRQLLIDAVLADTRAADMCPSAVLAPLLAVEEDVELARYIASAISASGGKGLRCDATCRALLAGDANEGGALLSRPLYGPFVELLGLGWTRERGIVDTLFEPLITTQDIPRHAQTVAWGSQLEEIPVAFAMDVIASALWQHRRLHGELPQLVARFADLFEPTMCRKEPE